MLSNAELGKVIARKKAIAKRNPSHPRGSKAILAHSIARNRSIAARKAKAPCPPLIQSHGATEVTTFEQEVHVVHASRRPGVTEVDVAANFDAMFGPGTFAKVRPTARFMLKDGGGELNDPSDLYILIIPLTLFNSIH